MPKVCLICKMEARPGGGYSFHCFPKKEETRQLWVKALQLKVEPNFNCAYVCSNHFDADCFTDCNADEQRKRRKLLTTAIPSLNPSSLDQKTVFFITESVLLPENNLNSSPPASNNCKTVYYAEENHEEGSTDNKKLPANAANVHVIDTNRKYSFEDGCESKKVKFMQGTQIKEYLALTQRTPLNFESLVYSGRFFKESLTKFLVYAACNRKKLVAAHNRNARKAKKIDMMSKVIQELEQNKELSATGFLKEEKIVAVKTDFSSTEIKQEDPLEDYIVHIKEEVPSTSDMTEISPEEGEDDTNEDYIVCVKDEFPSTLDTEIRPEEGQSNYQEDYIVRVKEEFPSTSDTEIRPEEGQWNPQFIKMPQTYEPVLFPENNLNSSPPASDNCITVDYPEVNHESTDKKKSPVNANVNIINKKRKHSFEDGCEPKKVKFMHGTQIKYFTRADFSSEESWAKFLQYAACNRKKLVAAHNRNARKAKKINMMSKVIQELEQNKELSATGFLKEGYNVRVKEEFQSTSDTSEHRPEERNDNTKEDCIVRVKEEFPSTSIMVKIEPEY